MEHVQTKARQLRIQLPIRRDKEKQAHDHSGISNRESYQPNIPAKDQLRRNSGSWNAQSIQKSAKHASKNLTSEKQPSSRVKRSSNVKSARASSSESGDKPFGPKVPSQ